jgi:CPA2 family monovalent cation:H+ antiporter-2
VAGDARNPEVLRRADIANCRLAVVCVPDDDVAHQVVRGVRELNPTAAILVRCRFLSNMAAAEHAGANAVVSEEREASGVLLQLCEEVVRHSHKSAANATGPPPVCLPGEAFREISNSKQER